MNEHELPNCDYTQPTSVVQAFIHAMYTWESTSAVMMKTDNPREWNMNHAIVRQRLDTIFMTYCTLKNRPRPRQKVIRYQMLPHYDLQYLVISEIEQVTRQRIHVYINDTRPLGDEYRFSLLKKPTNG